MKQQPQLAAGKAMSFSSNVALLAPVPLEHLESGDIVCRQAGKVAYGSRSWDVFAQLDILRGGLKVHTFFLRIWHR